MSDFFFFSESTIRKGNLWGALRHTLSLKSTSVTQFDSQSLNIRKATFMIVINICAAVNDGGSGN